MLSAALAHAGGPRRATGRSWSSTTPAPTGRPRTAAPFLDGPRVRLLRNDVNRGKGYSIRRGMLEAAGDLRLMCDADCVVLPRVAGRPGAGGRRGRRGGRLPARPRRPGRAPAGRPPPDRRCRLHRPHPPGPGAAAPRHLLRVQAVAGRLRRGGVQPGPTRRLGLRRRGTGHGPAHGIHHARGGHRVEQPARLAPLDRQRAPSGHRRAVEGPPQRPPGGGRLPTRPGRARQRPGRGGAAGGPYWPHWSLSYQGGTAGGSGGAAGASTAEASWAWRPRRTPGRGGSRGAITLPA